MKTLPCRGGAPLPPRSFDHLTARCAPTPAHHIASSYRSAIPSIAQRELLRQFYLSCDPSEQLQLVQESMARDQLDVETSLHMLCFTADEATRGRLGGEAAEQAALVQGICDLLRPEMPDMNPLQLGAVLWSLSCVDSARLPWSERLLDEVAAREVQLARVDKYNTKEVANMLFAAGKLTGRPPTAAVLAFASTLVAELVHRMASAPHVKSSFTMEDFADIAGVCAALFATDAGGPSCPELAPEGAATQLLDLVAGEVRRQLANKHSGSRSPFPPRDVVRLLQAYAVTTAAAGRSSAATAGMLDAIAGFVVSRVRSRHLNAVSRPEDLAAVLQAYADLAHHTVVIPELLAAVGEQLRRGAALEQDRACAGDLGDNAPNLSCALATQTALLRSHWRLGYLPEELTLAALAPGVRRLLPTTPAEDVGQLLELLAQPWLCYNPGQRTLGLMLARIADAASESKAAQQRLDAALQHAAVLGYSP